MLGQHKLMLSAKQLALFGAVLGLVFGTGAISYGDAFADGDPKADICYKGKDKEVKLKDVPKYLAKGASLGECDDDDEDDDEKGHGKGNFKHVLRGDGPPPDKLGKVGDLYFDTDTKPSNACMDFHVKISKHNWEKRGTVCDQAELEIAWAQLTGIPSGFADGVDDVDDADADPTNELQDLDLQGRDLSLSGSSVTIPLPFALDNQSCAADEAVIGIDANGDVICDKVAGEISLATEIVSGDTEELNFETNPDTSGTLQCSEGGIVTGFQVLTPSENGVVLITELSVNSAGDEVSYTLFNPSEDIEIEVITEVEGEEYTGTGLIPGRSIEVIPQIFCVSVITP